MPTSAQLDDGLRELALSAAREACRELLNARRLPIEKQWLSPRDVSEYIGLTTQQLTKLRRCGVGPRWRKLGDSAQSPIRYLRNDVDEWVRRHDGGGGEG